MVDGGNNPWNSKTKKYVDRIAPSNITNGVIRCLLRGCGDLAGEGVGEGGAKSHEGDGCDLNMNITSQL